MINRVAYWPSDLCVMNGGDTFRRHGVGYEIHADPCVEWGIYEDDGESDVVAVKKYCENRFRLFGGVPEENFTATDWFPLPKKWTYSVDLVTPHMSYDPKRDACREFLKSFRVDSPDMILAAADNDYIIPEDRYEAFIVESDVEKKRYRVVRKAKSLMYIVRKISFAMPRKRIFSSYREAFFAAEMICRDWIESVGKEAEIDRRIMIRETVERVPEKHRAAVESRLETLHYTGRMNVRVYGGRVLVRYDASEEWVPVFDFS